MDLIKEEIEGDEQQILKAQAHVWKHIFNFINSMALKCAVQLGIPDAINRHGCQPMTISDLVSALQLDADTKTQHIYRLMRILVHSEFFTIQKVNKDLDDGRSGEEEEDGYLLTESSRLLLSESDNPFSMTPFLISMFEPLLVEPWQFLSVWLKNNNGRSRTPFETAHGQSMWDYYANNPKSAQSFNEGMSSDARLTGKILVEKHKYIFEGLNSLVDVGGGTGTLAMTIAKAFPEIECSVFDLPRVVSHVKATQNFKVFPGDIFGTDTIPQADAVLLKCTLHNWNDEECVKILKKCKEAITRSSSNGKKGNNKVMILEIVVRKQDDQNEEYPIEVQFMYDLLMMNLLDTKERTEKEWAKLFHQAGFNDYKIYPILGLRSLIEIYP